MELSHHFTVPARVDDVWEAFNDLQRIAPCFPGAQLTSFDGDAFQGLVKVKLGPISLQYTGAGSFAERDDAAHRAVIVAKGRDKRGNGTAAATITAQLDAAGEQATDVTVTTDLKITGKPAQFGRGVMQDVSDTLLGKFTTCLETTLDSSQDEPPDSASPDRPVAKAVASPIESESEPPPSAAEVTTAPPQELNVGTTVLPILVRRYGTQLVVGLVVWWLARRYARRA